MKTSKQLSPEEISRLAAAVSAAGKPRASFTKASESASQPSTGQQPQALEETQRIGSLIIPKTVWAALWIHSPDAVRFIVGGEIVEVEAAGHWEPPRPKVSRELPPAKQYENHQSYYFRVRALLKGQPHGPEISEWIATRVWLGESSESLCNKIAVGQDVLGHTWKFVRKKATL